MSYTALHPQFVQYGTDGRGRDTYIGYNNGGFWKENIYGIHYKPNYPIYHPPKTISFHYEPAPFTYYSDGTGRDTYVINNNAGLTKQFKSLNQYRLKDFLRTPESCIFNFKSNPMKEGYRAKTIYVSEKELSRNKHIKTIENGLVKRLYKDEKYKFIPRLETETIDTGKNRFCLMKEYAMRYGRTQSCRCRTTPNHNTYEQKFFRNGKKKVKLSLLEI